LLELARTVDFPGLHFSNAWRESNRN